MKIHLVLLVAALWVSGCGSSEQPAPVSLAGPTLRILFIGNSYTYVNDLPHLFAQLAASGHHGVEVDSVVAGGWSLAQHANTAGTLSKISESKWDYVVLQDQSYLPALAEQRNKEFEPSVRYLDHAIREDGAKTLLYMTWGRQKGLPEQGFSDFDSMQTQLTNAYLGVAQELKIPVAPVGEAWKAAIGHDPGLALWADDGSHPSVMGTYLTACVFYASIYQTSPVGLDFRAGLSAGQAKALQTAAFETVLTDPGHWNLR